MARWLRGQTEHEQVEALLSPYLDGRTSEAERTLVERHLQSCADCARNLATLRATVAAVREMPPVRAPRSFALPRSMAKQPQAASWMFPVFRVATVLAVLLFVITVAGDLFLRGSMLPASVPKAAPVSIAKESVVTSAATVAGQRAAPVAPSAPQATMPAFAQAAPAATAPAAGTAALAMPAAPAEPPVEQPLGDGGRGGGMVSGDGPGAAMQPSSATPTAPVPVQITTAPPALAKGAAASATTTARSAESASEPTAGPPATTVPVAPPVPAQPTQIARAFVPQPPAAVQSEATSQAAPLAIVFLRIAEGALAGLAIALGVVTWITYRRSR
jgi:anti-sigma factor RsiW